MFDDLIGVPFEYGGRDPLRSLDCYGLVMEVYRRRGIELPEYQSTSDRSLIHRMIVEGREMFIEIPRPAPFCVVTFFIRPPYTSHLGVVMEDGTRFLHAIQKACSCVERLDSPTWKDRLTGFYLWKN